MVDDQITREVIIQIYHLGVSQRIDIGCNTGFKSDVLVSQSNNTEYNIDKYALIVADQILTQLSTLKKTKILTNDVDSFETQLVSLTGMVQRDDLRRWFTLLSTFKEEMKDMSWTWSGIFDVIQMLMERILQLRDGDNDLRERIMQLKKNEPSNMESNSSLSKLYLVTSALALSTLDQPTAQDTESLKEACNQILNMETLLQPADITFISMVMFDMALKTKDSTFLQDSFILATYANTIDPVGSESLMVKIGEHIIDHYSSFPWYLSHQFVEFVCRRISTCNMGSHRFAIKYCDLLLHNIAESRRDPILSNTFEYTEDLKRVLEKGFETKYFKEDIERFKQTKDLRHIYKALNSVYNTSQDTFTVNRAHKLAEIVKVVKQANEKMDSNEMFIILLNSVHNFFAMLQLRPNYSGISFIAENSTPFITDEMHAVFNLEASYFVISELFSIITSQKKEPILELFHLDNVDRIFPTLFIRTASEHFENICKNIIEPINPINPTDFNMEVQRRKQLVQKYLKSLQKLQEQAEVFSAELALKKQRQTLKFNEVYEKLQNSIHQGHLTETEAKSFCELASQFGYSESSEADSDEE